MKELFNQYVLPVLITLAVALVTYVGAKFTSFLNKKTKEIQAKTNNDTVNAYLQRLNDLVTNCVIVTNQTYVNALKDKNLFDTDAQKVALEKTYSAVMNTLTTEAKEVLATTVSDLPTYVHQLIERATNEQKK